MRLHSKSQKRHILLFSYPSNHKTATKTQDLLNYLMHFIHISLTSYSPRQLYLKKKQNKCITRFPKLFPNHNQWEFIFQSTNTTKNEIVTIFTISKRYDPRKIINC